MGGVPTEALVFLEHESREERHLPFWLLSYGVSLVQRWLKEHPRAKHIPFPLAVVVHQGTEPWKGPTSVGELYGFPPGLRAPLGRHGPELVPLIDDLGATSSERLVRRKGSPLMKLALALLREAGEDSDLAELLIKHKDLVEQVRSEAGGRAAFQLLLAYMMRVRVIEPVQLGDQLEQTLVGVTKEEVVTTAEMLEARGMKKGRAEGRVEGRAEDILTVLEARHLKVPLAVRKKVRACTDLSKLDHLLRRAAVISSAGELFD
jgi:hypothetical protein